MTRANWAGPAVGQVVAGHRSDDDVAQAEGGGGLGDPLGLVRLREGGRPFGHGAERRSSACRRPPG